MAKSTKGASKKVAEPVAVEEIVQDVPEVIVEGETEAPVVEAEIVEPSSDDAEQASLEAEELQEEIQPEEIDTLEDVVAAPEVVRETVVERKGGFIPMVLGGVVAAGIGVGSAGYIFPEGLPFGAGATEKVNLSSEIKLQAGRIDDLTALLEAQPKIDTGALDAAVSAVGDLQAQIGSVVDNVSAIETRIGELEARPSSGGSGVSAAMESELKELRAALDLQKGEITQMIDQAKSTKQSAEDTARQTMARAAVTRILVALDSGASFEDALADVQANSDIAVPEALAQTAATGIPTLAALSETYPEAARAALASVRSKDTGGGFSSFLAKQLGARSITPREGDDPDAVLSRVEAALTEGRLADALAQADALPNEAKAPLSDWMAQANLRLTAARDAEALATSLNSQ